MRQLTRAEVDRMEFGREYFIPKPFDRRVFVRASSAVAEAAIKDGAARKIIDIG